MSEDTTQTAVDATQTPAQPGVTDAGAQTSGGDELDKLLSEFTTQTTSQTPQQTAQPEPKAGTDSDLKTVLDEVKGLRTERAQERFQRDMGETIKNVRGDLDPEFFDDALVRGWIDAQAEQDTRLATAWANRHANPKQFQKVVETLGRNFSKKFSKLPDRGATDDREAVSHAVRGASKQAPDGQAPDYSRMTDAQLREAKDKLYG